MALPEAVLQASNLVFLGEAGCGKSEIAVNLALALAEEGGKPVHFFDLDMTKPLFRSRDAAAVLEAAGVRVHYEVQFMDAPTRAGGVARLLRDGSCRTILDVGGDFIGARAVGEFAALLNRDETALFYVVNSYRPWSMDREHIDGVLSQVAGAARLQPGRLRFVGNPHLGPGTTAGEVLEGLRRGEAALGTGASLAFCCARAELCPALETDLPLLPLRRVLAYPWEDEKPDDLE